MKISKLRGMPAVSVYPRVFPGPSTEDGASGNRAGPDGTGVEMVEACDWGTGRLFAYAHFTCVVLTDPSSGQVVATLDGHASDVTCVRFLGHNRTGDLLLGSGDKDGWVTVWDVGESEALRSMYVGTADAHSPSALSQPVRLNERVLAVRPVSQAHTASTMASSAHSQLPFRLVCLTPMCVTLLDPASNGAQWRYELGSPQAPLAGLSVNSREDTIVFAREPTPRCHIIPKAGTHGAAVPLCNLAAATGRVDAADGCEDDVLQHMACCPSSRALVYLVFSTEVVLYDLDIQQRLSVVCSVSTKRSPFRAIMCSLDGEAHRTGVVMQLSGSAPFFTLHHDGSVSAWVRKETGGSYLAVPVDLRSSRQGYTGRPFLLNIDRNIEMGRALAHTESGDACEDTVPHGRICVVSNDGSVATWQNCHTTGWSLSNLLPAIPAPVAAFTVLYLDVGAVEGPNPTLCCVLVTKQGCLLILDALTGAVLFKCEVMTERGCVPSLEIHRLNDSKILISGVKIVPKAGGGTQNSAGKAKPTGARQGVTNAVGGMLADMGTSAAPTALSELPQWCSSRPDEQYFNYIAAVDVPSLSTHCFKGTTAESCKLLSVAVAQSSRVFTALYTGGACEIWDVATSALLRRLEHPDAPMCSMVTWMPRNTVLSIERRAEAAAASAATTMKDRRNSGPDPPDVFVWLAADGTMTFFKLSARHEISHFFLNMKSKIYVGFGYPVTSVDWYDGLMLTGDTAGMICLVNLKSEKFSYISNQPRAAIRQVKICPKDYIQSETGETAKVEKGAKTGVTCLAMVLFVDGEFAAWNVAHKQVISSSKWSEQKARGDPSPGPQGWRIRHLKATAVSWVPGPFPVIASATGAVYILDLSLASSNSPVTLRALADPLRTPALLPRLQASFLHSCLTNGILYGQASDVSPTASEAAAVGGSRPFRNAFGELVCAPIKSHSEEAKLHVQLVNESVARAIDKLGGDSGLSILRRCYVVAAYFADEERLQFWRAALTATAAVKESLAHPSAAGPGGDPLHKTESAAGFEPPASGALESSSTLGDGLHSCSDLPIDEALTNSAALHASHCCATRSRESAARATSMPHHFRAVAAQHVRNGSVHPACRLLLDTPHTSPDWKVNLYKACTVAAGMGRRHYQHTVKRVASMLVAHGEIEEAVEMLCLIGKGKEACMAYQAHDMWEEAARLAKTCLAQAEETEVLQKWAEHLAQVSDDGEYVLQAATLYLSTHDVGKALSLLEPHLEHAELSAHLAAACVAEGILGATDATVAAVCAQYVDYLESISASDAADAFSSLMGRLARVASPLLEGGAAQASSGVAELDSFFAETAPEAAAAAPAAAPVVAEAEPSTLAPPGSIDDLFS